MPYSYIEIYMYDLLIDITSEPLWTEDTIYDFVCSTLSPCSSVRVSITISTDPTCGSHCKYVEKTLDFKYLHDRPT